MTTHEQQPETRINRDSQVVRAPLNPHGSEVRKVTREPRLATERPILAIGLRLRRRQDGGSYLAGSVAEPFLVPAGAVLTVTRLEGQRGDDACTHVLRVLPAACAPTRAVLQRAAADNLSGTATREHREAPLAERTVSANDSAPTTTP